MKYKVVITYEYVGGEIYACAFNVASTSRRGAILMAVTMLDKSIVGIVSITCIEA